MFKFDFQTESNEIDSECSEKTKVPEKQNDDIIWYESEEILPTQEHVESLNDLAKRANMFIANDFEIGYLNPTAIINKCSNILKDANTNHSDLVKGEYEGGLKVWECTQDLGEFLSQKIDEESEKSILNEFNGKLVLDLGCGAGLLGILAIKSGANVHFQDYNKDVLTNFTIPNVLLNLNENLNETNTRAKFYSGDWESFDHLTENTKYDIILSSETIYNPDNQQKLLEIFKNKLKPDGMVFLAAKIYYFGVGGGIRQFENLILKDKNLKAKVVWRCTDGVQREILRLSF